MEESSILLPVSTSKKVGNPHWALIRKLLAAKGGVRKAREDLAEAKPHLSTAMPEPEFYRQSVVLLAKDFPELEVLTSENVRHSWSSRIVFYDYTKFPNDGRIVSHEPWRGSRRAPEFSEFKHLLQALPPDSLQRVILVEDLNPSLIDMLGVAFEIPPQIFADHLKQSGYSPTFEKERSDDWNMRSSIQGHIFISWYRPVLLNGKQQSTFHNSSTMANICRASIGLCCEPGLYHKGSKSEYPVGWEERATIWTREIDGHQYRMLDSTRL
jgi:hypothetical protein